MFVQDALHEDSIAIFAKENDVARNLHASEARILFVNEATECGPIGEQLANSAKFADILHGLL